MIASAALSRRALSMFGRVFPRCSMIAQAIAFNLFLAFFPTLLIAVGLATSPLGGRTALFDLISDLTSFLPPGSQQIVSEFLVKRGPQAWKWALVGLGGTLLAGTQVMKLLMEGIHTIYGDRDRPGFFARQLRALARPPPIAVQVKKLDADNVDVHHTMTEVLEAPWQTIS